MRRTGSNTDAAHLFSYLSGGRLQNPHPFSYKLNLYPTVIINALLLLDSPSADNA